MRRAAAVLAMAVFGVAVYLTLGALRSKAATAAHAPTATRARVDVAGTMYLAQQGVLYRLSGGGFTRLSPGGPGGAWMQPAPSPDRTHLVAVNRAAQFSDLWLLDLGGHAVRQLTNDAGGRGALAHWAFYPRYSPDGSRLYYSFDAPKYLDDYRVDLAVWSLALGSSQRAAVRQSSFNDYTGGDTYPIPLDGGALLYAKYGVGANGPYSQIWYQARTLSPGKPLTKPEDDCSQPALSPDGTRLAMVCTGGLQSARLEVADFNAGDLGTPRELVGGVVGGSPAWAPDARSIAYLASAGAGRHFQLWTVPAPADGASPAPVLARQLTTDLDFDATSAPAWM